MGAVFVSFCRNATRHDQASRRAPLFQMVFSNKLMDRCRASGNVRTTKTRSHPRRMRKASEVFLLRSDFTGERHAQASLCLRTRTFLIHKPRMPVAYQLLLSLEHDGPDLMQRSFLFSGQA